MKKLFLGLLLIAGISSEAQITLEHTYPNTGNGNFLMFTQLDATTYKYIDFEPQSSQFTIYNLNHSLYLNVNIPITFVSGSAQYQIAFVTKSLFDCDTSSIEYALSFLGDGSPFTYPKKFYVFRTNGTQLANIDSCCFMNYSNGWQYGPLYNEPIVNTPTGTKIILRCLDGSSRIYSVCGSLPCQDCSSFTTTGIATYTNHPKEGSITNYPNPSSGQTTIEYELPQGATIADLVFYDMAGREVKRYKVSNAFKDILISTDELAAGTYYYQLQTAGGFKAGKKMVVIK